jgi:Ca2+/Na+ antiporter
VAAKNQQIELMTSSIIGSQIFNLQICLGLPWLIKTFLSGNISLNQTTMFGSIVVVVVIVLISMMVMLCFKLRLTYGLGICLVFTYGFYAGFEYVENT